MYRYLVFVWDSENPVALAGARQLTSQIHSMPAWTAAQESRGLGIYSAGGRPGATQTLPLAGDSGAILGTLFGRQVGDTPPTNAALNSNIAAAFITSAGQALIDFYWGRYVAVVHDATTRTTRVIRDPSGSFPCWQVRHRDVDIFFSDLEDILALGLGPFAIDWDHIGALVARIMIQTRATTLGGITELLPGECVKLQSGVISRHSLWSPAAAACSDPIEDSQLAASELRRLTRGCIQAWAACHSVILQKLSGGLDSSIVATSLAGAPSQPRVVCLNHFGTGPEEDERDFARAVARRGGLELVEHRSRADTVRLRAMFEVAGSVRPWSYLYGVEHARFETELAREHGATAMFGGAYGDAIFYATQPQLAVKDFIHQHGLPSRRLMSIALDVARIQKLSVWSVLGEALRRSNAYAFSQHAVSSQIVSPALMQSVSQDPRYSSPWADGLAGLPPGKRHHVQSLWPAAPFYEPFSGPDEIECVYPLMSQPVIELCLRMPTYVLVQGSRNRGLVRRAFAQDLPVEILRRRGKGGITQHVKEIFDSNLPFLREALLDGELVTRGFLDRAQLEAALQPDASATSNAFGEILTRHLSLEAWLQRSQRIPMKTYPLERSPYSYETSPRASSAQNTAST